MTSPKLARDLLIADPSLAAVPTAPVFAPRSLPARSTKFNLPAVNDLPPAAAAVPAPSRSTTLCVYTGCAGECIKRRSEALLGTHSTTVI